VHLVAFMILAMVFWGAGWPALKIVTEYQSVEVVTFWRFFLMFIAFIPLLIWWRKPLPLTPKAFIYSATGAALNTAFMFLSYWGVKLSTAGSGGVIATTLSPVLTLLLVILIFRSHVEFRQWIGLIVGFIGGVMMLEIWHIQLLSMGNALIALSALVWAFLTLVSQRSYQYMNPLHFSFMLSLFATLVSLVLAWPHNIFNAFHDGWIFWLSIAFLAIFGQTIASTIYFYASGKLGSGHASSYMFMVPLTALLSSYLLLGEIPSFWLVVGGTVSLLAVYIANRRTQPDN
jgi:drug/metabolite transporter (DMT)-like permease